MPETLTCSECGEEVDDQGYLPATDDEGVYRPKTDLALCGACGFNEVGFAGCAPDLEEVVDPGPDDALLHVRVTDEGIDVVSSKT